MKTKLISAVFAVTVLVSLSMPVYSSSLCESIQQHAAQAQAAFNSAHQTWQQVCTSAPSSNQCAVANTNLIQTASTANNANGAAETCRIFYMIK